VSAASDHRVQMRWSDLDGLGHVYHAAALTYLEEGRDRFLGRHGISRDEYVVGSCTLRFNHEIGSHQEAVTVACELRRVGNSSLATSESIVLDDGQVAVEAEFGLVLWDRERRTSRPLSAAERASLTGAA
jgi:acyl-CoA thioester hydrolase